MIEAKKVLKTKINGEWVDIPAIKGGRGPAGEPGADGQPGRDGSDASVTAANITSALGYTPANAATSALKADLSTLQTSVDGIQQELVGVSALADSISEVVG